MIIVEFSKEFILFDLMSSSVDATFEDMF